MDKPCNVCDNCRRKEGHGLPVVSKDITIEAITAAKIANAVQSKTDDRVTMIKMVNYMRGRGHKKAGLEALFQSGDVEAATKRKWTDAEMEMIVTHLLTEGYLWEDFHYTPYSSISYLKPGPLAKRLLPLKRSDIENGRRPIKIEMDFLQDDTSEVSVGRPSKRQKTSAAAAQAESSQIYTKDAVHDDDEIEYDLSMFNDIVDTDDETNADEPREIINLD